MDLRLRRPEKKQKASLWTATYDQTNGYYFIVVHNQELALLLQHEKKTQDFHQTPETLLGNLRQTLQDIKFEETYDKELCFKLVLSSKDSKVSTDAAPSTGESAPHEPIVPGDNALTVKETVSKLEALHAKGVFLEAQVMAYDDIGREFTAGVVIAFGNGIIFKDSTTASLQASRAEIKFEDGSKVIVTPVTDHEISVASHRVSPIDSAIYKTTEKFRGCSTLDNMPIWSPNHLLVEPSHECLQSHFEEEPQADKNWTVVVAGESGSGKTVLASTAPMKFGYSTLYVKVEAAVLNGKPTQGALPTWQKLIKGIMTECHGNTQEEMPPGLLRLKSELNITRNSWAWNATTRIIEKALDTDQGYMMEWWNSRKLESNNSSNKHYPDKLAIVVDEATDLDFAEAMVDIGRTFSESLASLTKSKHVRLVVCGTGLDDLDRSAKCVGTDLSKSRTIIVKGPSSLDHVLEAKRNELLHIEHIMNAVRKSPVASACATNSRLFFRGLVPILSLPMHKRDTKENNEDTTATALIERLSELCKCPHFTSYAARMYIGSNSIKDLPDATPTSLLEEAFVFHVLEASKELAGKVGAQYVTEIQETRANARFKEKNVKNDNDTIFHRGLARRSGTSPALKYLACCGLTCPLEASRGLDFENLVALHLSRTLELQGKSVIRIELKGAWPPPSGPDRIGQARVNNLKTILEGAWHHEDRELIKRTLEKGNGCIVFRQGYPMAQGPDLFVVFFESSKLVFHLVQCKHYKDIPGFEKTRKWWSSIGVHVTGTQERHSFQFNRKILCPAAWSQAGIDVFGKLLTELCSKATGFVIKKRIMAASSLFDDMIEKIPLPSDCELMSKEMLEPTISVFQAPFDSEDMGEAMFGESQDAEDSS